jgi:hypothetical protein
LIVVLNPANGDQKPITFDLLPKAVNEEQTETFTISLSPSIKFSSIGNLAFGRRLQAEQNTLFLSGK